MESFRDIIRGNVNIINTAASNTIPGKSFNSTAYKVDEEKSLIMNNYFCDHDFAGTLSLNMVEGRFLSNEFATDSSAIVLNRKAVEELGV